MIELRWGIYGQVFSDLEGSTVREAFVRFEPLFHHDRLGRPIVPDNVTPYVGNNEVDDDFVLHDGDVCEWVITRRSPPAPPTPIGAKTQLKLWLRKLLMDIWR